MSTPGGAGGGIWLGPPDRNDVRNVLEVQAAPGPLGEGGTFYINPERAEGCIRALRAVALDLIDARFIMDFAYFPPPGADHVSTNLAEQARVMADRALSYIDTWRSQLEVTAESLEQQLAAYRGTEETQRSRFV